MTRNIITSRPKEHSGRTWLASIAFAVAFTLVGCASTPVPPTAELQAAELAIRNAEQARVADYAAAELKQAREKLAAANTAVQKEEMVRATYLAEESKVSADLASARTQMAKAKAVNDEMQASLDTLKQELQRNTGGGR